jgi:hypothetical protein
MKTFFVTIVEPKVRAVHTTKMIVPAESKEQAEALVKGYYPVGCKGWHPQAKFAVIEIPAGTCFSV